MLNGAIRKREERESNFINPSSSLSDRNIEDLSVFGMCYKHDMHTLHLIA